MKIAEAIEQIKLAVNGGSLTADSNVQSPEIKSLLGVVISHYKKIDADVREEKFIRKARLAMSSISNILHNTYYDFTVTYRLTPVYNEERDEHYVILPVNVDNAMGRIGIKNLESIKEGHVVHVASSRAEMSGLKDIMDRYAYYEKSFNTDDERVWIRGLGIPVGELLLRLIPEFTDIDEDQAIPVNEGYHKMIIDDCVKFFRDQKFITADNYVDSVDINEKTQNMIRNAVHNNRTASS